MTRQLRIEYPGAFYHVMAHGNGFQWIYKSDEHIKLFQEVLSRHNSKLESGAIVIASTTKLRVRNP